MDNLVAQTAQLEIKPHLLTIAPELRQLIYAHVFEGSSVMYLIHESNKQRLMSSSINPAAALPYRSILLVCKQVFAEAISTYWQRTVLRLSGAYWRSNDVVRFLSEPCTSHVTTISLETLSHAYAGIVGVFPSLEHLRVPDQEVLWWFSGEYIRESDVERELKEAMRFNGIWETVRKYRKLSITCRISVILKIGNRTMHKVSRSKSRYEWRVNRWTEDF
jgi:hypothetical protein